MSIQTHYILMLVIPLLTAVGVLMFRRSPNLRETVTLVGGGSLFAVVASLAADILQSL